jgi:type III secretion protein V
MKSASALLLKAIASPGLVLALFVGLVLMALVVPLPGWGIDLGLALSLMAAVGLLVASLFARDALKLASFPTLLLLTTLFRLALNVSSTRLALSEGQAGEIIGAFGEFVIQGDYVVGFVVFAILALVQFLVVARGAERVAEVSARFTLDAMPGKQMSIDADLRAGAIDQVQARARRRVLERESQLFGAMDGAMKFVKGDVLAGLVIVGINLLGGTLIGVLQQGLSFSEAASVYSLLAIGDGLSAQLPSICIAVAAGLMVTRVSSEREDGDLAADIAQQVLADWRVPGVVAVLFVALALVPGMPHGVLALLALALGGSSWWLWRRSTAASVAAPGPGQKAASQAPKPETDGFGVAPLAVELAAELDWLVTEGEGALLRDHLPNLRKRLCQELGLPIPGIRVRTQAPLQPNTYALLFEDVPVATGTLESGTYALASPIDLSFLGVDPKPARHPVSGRVVSRVDPARTQTLTEAQIEVRTAAELFCEHLASIIRRRAFHLVGVQETQLLLDACEKNAPDLVRELKAKIPLPLCAEVLRLLLREQVSIRNLRAILEALVSPHAEGNAAALAERCRQALQRQLSHQYASQGTVFAFLVDPAVEESIRSSGPDGALEPTAVSRLMEAVKRIVVQGRAVLLTSPDVRRVMRRLLEGSFPEVAVLTYTELSPDLQVRPLGKLSIDPA